MAIPMRQDQQQDADAVYVRDRIASADRLEAEGKAEEQSGSTKRKQAEQERIQAGLRLIDVRERFVKECGQDRCPHEFAQWYRKNGFEQSQVSRLMKLAGSDEEERDAAKAKERDRKRESRAKAKPEVKRVWNMVLIQALGENVTRAIKRGYKSEVEQLVGEEFPSSFTSDEEADAFVDLYVRKVGLPQDTERESLPKTAEEKIQRAIRVETAKLNQSYHDEVEKGIKAQLADRIAHLESLREKAASRAKRYETMLAGITPVITKDDYRFLLNTLHSDRVPTPEKMDKAFNIIKKLEPYIEAQSD